MATLNSIQARSVETPSGCWAWTGYINARGYGQVRHQRRLRRGHRLAYILAKGPISDGFEIDHLCRQRDCVNPPHLEAVTHQENCRRYTRLITHCPQGHEYTPENTKIPADGYRDCRTCQNEPRRELHLRAKMGNPENSGPED